MEIVIDASELVGFADAMAQAGDEFKNEMTASNAVLLHEGIGYAQEEVPRDSGNLAGSIRILEGPTAEGGAYGSDLVYAWQREEGGTIHARNKKALAFRIDAAVTPDNPEGWVFVKSVTQKGSHYMKKSKDRLEPRTTPVYQRAIDRVLGRI